VNKRDLNILKQGYEAGYLNALLKASDGREPFLEDSSEIEAEECGARSALYLFATKHQNPNKNT
jgi:hypothetical protein